MSKNITFTANEPLTTEQMNSLLQDGQIQQETGTGTSELMSQDAITKTINDIYKNVKFNAIPELGNATTMQEALTYIAGILNGSNKITKLSVKELDLVD